jgi:hypothetical protein
MADADEPKDEKETQLPLEPDFSEEMLDHPDPETDKAIDDIIRKESEKLVGQLRQTVDNVPELTADCRRFVWLAGIPV